MSFERWGENFKDADDNAFSEAVARCVESGDVFTDAKFPPDDKSLFFDAAAGRKTWKCHDCNKSNPLPEKINLGPSRDEIRNFFRFISQTNPLLALQMHSSPQLATQILRESFPGGAGPREKLKCVNCGGESPLGLLDLVPTQWLRPDQIQDDVTQEYGMGAPWELIRGQVEPEDVRQGAVGNCWFVGALSILAQQKPGMISSLFPFEQEYSPFGIYLVRLCKDGLWRNVLVDDYFPCNRNGSLCYTGAARRQLWVPLIEKAAAKLASCYEGLHSGTLSEAFSLLTGCSTERVILVKGRDALVMSEEDSDTLWTRVVSSHDAGHLVGLACASRPDKSIPELHCLGLQAPHAYTLSDTVEIFSKGRSHRLVKLRNPWGVRSPSTWNGDWGIHSEEYSEWKKTTNDESHNGWFWMEWADVLTSFASIEFCRTVNEAGEVRARGWLGACTGLGDRFEIIFTTGDNTDQLAAFDISLYQESHAVRGNQRGSFVDLGVMVLADGVTVHRQERRFEPEVSFVLFLKPNTNYSIIPLSFANAFKVEHRKIAVCVRPARADIRRLTLERKPLALPLLRAAVLRYCHNSEKKEVIAGLMYSVTQDPVGAVVTAQNRTLRFYNGLTIDTTDSIGIANTRADTIYGMVTFDCIPPMSEQVLQVITGLPDADGYSLNLSSACTRESTPKNDMHVPIIDGEPLQSTVLEIHRPCTIDDRLKLRMVELVARAKTYQDKSFLIHAFSRQNTLRDRLYHEYVQAGISHDEALQISNEEAEMMPL